MLFLSPNTWPTIVVLLCVAVLVFLLGRTRWVLTRVSTTALGSASEVDIRAGLQHAVQKWWKRRVGAVALGIVLGTAASAFYVWFVGADRSGPPVDLLTLGAAVGGVVACFGVGVGRRRRPPASGPRVAHTHRTVFADFVSDRLRIAAWAVAGAAAIAVGISLILAALSSHFGGFSTVLGPSILLLLLSGTSLGACEFLGRLIVAAPSRASTASQLVSDDVVRRLVVRDLAAATLGLGLASMALTAPDVIVNLDVRVWPGSATELFWLAAAVGTLALVSSLVYPVWVKAPAVGDPASTGLVSAARSSAAAEPR